MDLLLDPAAKAVLDAHVPDLLKPLAGAFGDAAPPPGMTTILSPRLLLGHRRPHADVLIERLDRELRCILLTPEMMRERCARYDRVPPVLPDVIARPAVLVFDKITGFRDAPSGDALTLRQREDFKTWIEDGGGFAAMHGSAGDPITLWDWYADTLIGARFSGHPVAPQFQPGRVLVEPGHEIVKGPGSEWTMTEEWYSFRTSPRAAGTQVLVTLDERSYAPVGLFGADLRMGDHPLAWARQVGRGRSFYSAIGHRPESYSHPQSVRLLEQGLAWAMRSTHA